MDRSSSRPIGWGDVTPLLHRLQKILADEKVILVGGQALGFWEANLPVPTPNEPLTSKDLDFYGDANAAKQFALALGGQAFFPSIDQNTISTGLVRFADGDATREIDFVGAPYGLSDREVVLHAVPAHLLDADGNETGTVLRVMDPISCLKSRVSNTMDLPNYDSNHGILQLKTSVVLARAFILETLRSGNTRGACRMAERIYHLAHNTRVGRAVIAKFNIDPLDAIPHHANEWPTNFKTKRHPQIVAWVHARRARAARRH